MSCSTVPILTIHVLPPTHPLIQGQAKPGLVSAPEQVWHLLRTLTTGRQALRSTHPPSQVGPWGGSSSQRVSANVSTLPGWHTAPDALDMALL